MNRLLSRFCLGLACLLVTPAVSHAQFGKRTVSKSKSKAKSKRKARKRSVKRVSSKRTTRKRLKSTRGPLKSRSKSPSKLKAPPGRRAPRTRAPRGRAYRNGYYGRGYNRGGYRNGYNDGYDDARYHSRRRGDGGGTSGQRSTPKKAGPPSWSGGLLIGGAGGETVFDEAEHDTSIGVFGELNFRGVVARNVSMGIHAGAAHNRVQTNSIDSVVLGSLGADLAYHFSRGRAGPYLRGGVGFAHATLDPGDAFLPESTGGGWYAKAGVGISTGTLLIEGNCTQYNFDDLAMPGGPGKSAEFTRCGIALGFGR